MYFLREEFWKCIFEIYFLWEQFSKYFLKCIFWLSSFENAFFEEGIFKIFFGMHFLVEEFWKRIFWGSIKIFWEKKFKKDFLRKKIKNNEELVKMAEFVLKTTTLSLIEVFRSKRCVLLLAQSSLLLMSLFLWVQSN